MKIRSGWISNSSTTSFCIYGAQLKEEPSVGDDQWEYFEDNTPTGFEVEYGFDDEAYMGISWKNIKDDETGAEFKTRIREKIMSKFNYLKEEDFHTFEEAYRDG